MQQNKLFSEKGLTQHTWIKQYPSKDFRHYHFDYCSQVFKEYLKDNKQCDEGYMKCNMENVQKEHIILSNQIIILNVIRKYHTTTDNTKRHMKIHTMKNSMSLFPVCQKIHLQEPQEESS